MLKIIIITKNKITTSTIKFNNTYFKIKINGNKKINSKSKIKNKIAIIKKLIS